MCACVCVCVRVGVHVCVCVLCILTSFKLLHAPESWQKYFLWPFQTFFFFSHLFSSFQTKNKNGWKSTFLFLHFFINIKQVFLLYQLGSLVKLQLISLIPWRVPQKVPPSCEAPREPTIYDEKCRYSKVYPITPIKNASKNEGTRKLVKIHNMCVCTCVCNCECLSRMALKQFLTKN